MTDVPTFCRVCEPSCGLVAEVEDGQLKGLRPDRDHPVTKGFACHKGIAGLDIHHDPDRLNQPMRRTEAGFVASDWDTAAAEIAAVLRRVLDEDGPDAISAYVGNPSAFNTLVGPAIGSFFGQLGVRRSFSSGTQDCSNKFAGSEAVFGTSTCHPVPDIAHADVVWILGENPRVSKMSFISIADPLAELRAAVKRGATVRYVNPRRIEKPEANAGVVTLIRPDTDTYFLAAIVHTLFEERLVDEAFAREHGTRVAELQAFAADYPAERVAPGTGIEAEEIRRLAREFAGADRAAIHMSTGVNMGRQGTLAYWLMSMLSFLTGNLGERGGNMLSVGFYPAAKAGRTTLDPDKLWFDHRHGKLRKIRGSLPGNLMADEIVNGDPKIKVLFVVSGNPLLSVGGEQALREAFESLELLVTIDLYRNATGELADWCLPATDMFERPDVNWAGLGLQYQPFVQYTDAVVLPQHERKPEWWILGRLEKELGMRSVLDAGPEPPLFGRVEHMLRSRDLTLEQLRAEPRGAVLPPLEPGRFFEEWIQTPDQKVDACPPLFEEALTRCAAIFDELAAEAPGSLKLISRREPSMHNSWYHNVERMKGRKSRSNPLTMHPDDAAARGLAEGERVLCKSAAGEIEVAIAFDADLMPGVVALTHGWGQQKTAGMRVAQRHPGVNANRLLPSGPGSFEPLSNQAHMTGIPVEVEPVPGS
ncbi:MAG: molybdopterin-containing oxidoreductase family protein [Myxococcota bacterium]